MVPAMPVRTRWGPTALAVCCLLAWGGDVAAQSTLHTLRVGTRTRSYNLYVPPSYAGESAVPLVVVLHGWAGNGRAMEIGTGFSALADRAGFIVAYPNALGFPAVWNYGWGPSNGDPELDVAFFDQLFDSLESDYFIDPNRIFVTGVSDGASMTHFLGAVLSHRITAIAPVAGAAGSYKYGDLLEMPPPKHPVSVVLIHGFLDPIFPWEGGPWGGFLIPAVSVPHSTGLWVTANGCDPKPVTRVSKDERVIEETFLGGVNGSFVRRYTLVDAYHNWYRRPGFDSAEVIWQSLAELVR